MAMIRIINPDQLDMYIDIFDAYENMCNFIYVHEFINKLHITVTKFKK